MSAAGSTPTSISRGNYADAPTRMKAIIKFLRQIPSAAANIRTNLKTPMPASFIKYGVAGFGGFADYYTGDAKKAFASVKDKALQKDFDDAAAAASKAMSDLATWLDGQKAIGDAGLRAGRRQVPAHDARDRRRRYAARPARSGGPRRPQEEPGCAEGRMRPLRARQDAPAVHGQDGRQQAGGERPGRRGAAPDPDAEGVRAGQRHRLGAGHRTGAGRGKPALQPAELRLYRPAGTVR